MAVEVQERTLDRDQAKQWIAKRGIDRLPRKTETLEYGPPGSYDRYFLKRDGNHFALTARQLS